MPMSQKVHYNTYAQCGFENSDLNPDGTVKKDAPSAQLYNLKLDPEQKRNVILQYPEKARELKLQLEKVQKSE